MSRTPRYSRLDRVNEALREVVADELELVDDDRLELVTVTGVKVDPDLRRAVVWFSSLSRQGSGGPRPRRAGGDTPTVDPASEVASALSRHRVRLQAAIARQLRLKRTPELAFRPDPAIASGTKVEEILRGLHEDRP